MNFQFENYIITKLLDIQGQKQLSDFTFTIESEQEFVKKKVQFEENNIHIIYRMLTDNKSIGATTQPIQLLVLTEQNGLDVSKILFEELANELNFTVVPSAFIDGNDFIKQQWTSPVVLSNFNPVAYGYRSVMYMNCNLYIMADVLDVNGLVIDTVAIDPMSFQLAYSMNGNTQQKQSEYIASTVKSVSTANIGMTVALQDNAFVRKCLNILNQTNTGNETFAFSFYVGPQVTGNLMSFNMKLISLQLITAKDSIPTLQLGFMV